MLISHNGIIENGSPTMTRLYQKALNQKKPITCMIGLTYYCNLQCKMCAFSYPKNSKKCGDMISAEQWKALLLQLKDNGIVDLAITGGEPLSKPDFTEIYLFAYNLGFKITIKTNATLVDEKIKEVFSKYPPLNTMITIYGGSPETYKKVTGQAGGYERVFDAIEFFRTIKTKLILTLTLIKENVHDIPLILNKLQPLNLRVSLCTDIHKHINNEIVTDYYNSRLSPAQRICLHNYYLNESEQALAEAEILEKELSRREPDFISENSSREPKSEKTYCLDALLGFFLDADGSMRYCQEYITPKQYPLEIGIAKSWENMYSEMDNYYFSPQMCNDCKYKKYCVTNCPARLVLNGMGTESIDKYTCDYAFLNMIYKEEYKKNDK